MLLDKNRDFWIDNPIEKEGRLLTAFLFFILFFILIFISIFNIYLDF